MKKNVMVLAVMLLGAVSMNAQEKKEEGKKVFNQEEMLKMQSERMANRMMLDDADAAKFTDLYQKYQKELNGLREKKHDEVTKVLTDAEIEARMKAKWDRQRKMVDVQEKYFKEFRKFLTVKQAQQVLNQRQGGRRAMGQHRFQGKMKQQNHKMMNRNGMMKRNNMRHMNKADMHKRSEEKKA